MNDPRVVVLSASKSAVSLARVRKKAAEIAVPSLFPGKVAGVCRGSQPLAGPLRKLGSCAEMKLRGHHLRAATALETRENADAAAAGVADRHDAVFNRDTPFALALFA
jgi:hypothetical protein